VLLISASKSSIAINFHYDENSLREYLYFMSKRKLTRKQAWRIDKIQQERAARAEKKDARISIDENEGNLGQEQEGLVIAHYGTQVEVQGLSEGDATLAKRCHMRANLGSLVTGDRIIWRDAEPTGVVVAVLPRDSELSRPDPHGDMKTVAANIDNILVVIAPLPRPHSFLIDRYLVAAEAIGIKPVIVINKIDLINEKNHHIIEDLTTLYQELNYTVIGASTTQGDGLQDLTAFLKNKTTVFVGQSGVGKSSLINQLLPGKNLRVGALSESTQRGTHTTTTAQLFHFPLMNGESGGRLIDSPGIREFGLWHMTESEILEGFIELQDYIGECKFRDCYHKQEPGCAILQAYENGKISERRMTSYLSLRENIEH
jgi:ribosome biogenesis GTPase